MWEEANEDPDPAHPNAQPSPSPLAHAISAGPAFASLVRTTQPRTFGSLLVSQMRAQGMLPARQDGTPARVATPARTSTDGEAPHARGEDERLPASRMSSARGDGPSREQQQLNREALLSLRTLESLGGASVEALASGMRIGSRYPPPAPTRTPGSKTRWDRARGRSWAQGALGDLVAEAMLHGTTTPPGHGTQRQSRASSRRSSVLLGADGSRAEAARPGSAASVFRVSRSDNGNGEESAERVRWAEGQGETRGRGGEGGGEGQGGDSQLPELSQFTEGDVEKIRKIQAAGKLMLAKRKARRSLEGEFVKAGEKGGNVVEGEQEGGEGDGDGIAGEGGGKTEAGETGGAVECTKGEVAGEKKDMEGEEGNVGEEERGQDGKKRIAEDISGIDMKSDGECFGDGMLKIPGGICHDTGPS